MQFLADSTQTDTPARVGRERKCALRHETASIAGSDDQLLDTGGICRHHLYAARQGFQAGEAALSMGYQRAISERATVTFGGAFSGDDKSVGMGAGFGW